jgi:antitoxin HicB
MKTNMRKQKIYSYTVVLEPAEEGGYNVSVPALPGCFTQGETLEEALAMAKEAISCHITALRKDGEPVPEEREGVTLKAVAVAV